MKILENKYYYTAFLLFTFVSLSLSCCSTENDIPSLAERCNITKWDTTNTLTGFPSKELLLIQEELIKQGPVSLDIISLR